MNIFKRKPQINTEDIFNQILNYEDSDVEIFNQLEMDFLQTPNIENIKLFYSYFKELKSYKKRVFFDSFISIINTITEKEKQLKIKLFAQNLLYYYFDNINMNPDNEKDILDSANFFFFLSGICDGLDMHEKFITKLLKKQETYSKEVLKPFFDQLRKNKLNEELYYV